MRVFIFGANGMLGRYLVRYLSSDFQVIPITRKEIDLGKDFSLISKKYQFENDDVIINAAGVIKQRNYSLEELIRVNSLFPQFLSTLNCNVIHITTDCVFSGVTGSYTEDSLHDCLDDYGKSKSLGENPDLTIIRTSIIGEELQNKKSLIEWVKTNRNTTIKGYLNHFWNGVTCLELAKHIVEIIKTGLYWKGVRHYFSPDTVSKYQLVSYINEIYELGNEVIPTMSEYCDRSLKTKFNSPVTKSIKDQLIELSEYGLIDLKDKMKGFPSLNFISIFESADRRRSLYKSLNEYGITNIRPHIYERYKKGDHKVIFPNQEEFPDYNWDGNPDSFIGAFTSHLKAIKDWYENTDEPYAFFCEDDIGFETIQYWNFTWEEFFNNLPDDWSCVQLSLTRTEPTMFVFFDPEVCFRHRCWCDWSAYAYLINRDRAKKLLDTYYDGETFIFEYKGSDKEIRKLQGETWPYAPGIETIIFSILDDEPVYTFPLFVFNPEFETTVWNISQQKNEDNIAGYSYSSIINWWKTRGKQIDLDSIFMHYLSK
jgi:dTDP-4-dehydrorhamnose reductase